MVEEYTCMQCGFMTSGKEDLIKHMSQTWEVEEDNCSVKSICVEEHKVEGGKSMKFTEEELEVIRKKQWELHRLKQFMINTKIGCGEPLNGDRKNPNFYCGEDVGEPTNEPFFCEKCMDEGLKKLKEKSATKH